MLENTYFILRHGQTVYQTEKKNEKYPWPESSPILLTKKGKEQAKVAAEKLKPKRIDVICSSDAPRARQTAAIVARRLGVKIIFAPRLRDVNHGIYGGRPKQELKDFFTDKKQRFTKRPPGGESWGDVKARVMNFFKEIDKKHKNKTILIVSHGDPLWLLQGGLKGLTKEELLEEKYERYKGLPLKAGQFRRLKL